MKILPHVVSQLRKARDQHHRECERIDHALSVLGTNHNSGTRTLSKDARDRIAAAQRLRWARVRKGKKTAATINVVKSKSGSKIKNYWARMTKAERAAEMQRRMAKR